MDKFLKMGHEIVNRKPNLTCYMINTYNLLYLPLSANFPVASDSRILADIPLQIRIIGSYGDAAVSNLAKYRIENAYDGANQNCYIPGTNKNSKARFIIQNSMVSFVRILNRIDYCR